MSTLKTFAIVVPSSTTPGTPVDVSTAARHKVITYKGSTGDQIAFEVSNNGTAFAAPLGMTRAAGLDGKITIETDFVFTDIRAHKLKGAGGGTCELVAEPLSAGIVAVEIEVRTDTTPGEWADTSTIGASSTLLYVGTTGDRVLFEGSVDGSTDPFTVDDQTLPAGISGFAIIQTELPPFVRCTRLKGTTSGVASLAGLPMQDQGGPVIVGSLVVGDTSSSSYLGGLSAAASVDAYSHFIVTQETADRTILLRDPTNVTAGREATVQLTDGSVSIIMYGLVLVGGTAVTFWWSGSRWNGPNSVQRGGNAFGEAMTLGTIDAFAVDLVSGDDLIVMVAGDIAVTSANDITLTSNADLNITGTSATHDVGIGSALGIILEATGPIVLSAGGSSSVFVGPRGVTPGSGGRVGLAELLANGAHTAGWVAPDAVLVTYYVQMPNRLPTYPGQAMGVTPLGFGEWYHPPVTFRTTTFVAFVQPAVGATVDVTVASSANSIVGQTVYVPGGGQYIISTIPNGTTVRLLNRYTFNTTAGVTVAAESLTFWPQGSGTLNGVSGGFLDVAWPTLTADADIRATRYLDSGSASGGVLSIQRTAGVGFRIQSSQAVDDRLVTWKIERE